MKLYAVLSDIHSNYEALKAIVQDADRQARKLKADDLYYICLGDVVDYGPQPNECMDWVVNHADIVVLGNHDREVAEPKFNPPQGIGLDYWPITLWTRSVLKGEYKDKIHKWKPSQVSSGDLREFTLLHSCLVNGDAYIKYPFAARKNFWKLDERETQYGLFGHTHYQGYFVEERNPFKHHLSGEEKAVMYLTCPENSKPKCVAGWRTAPVNTDTWVDLPYQKRALINPGSVGQPRQHAYLQDADVPHDYRASYMLLRLNSRSAFQFRRVDYDVGKTIQLLERIGEEMQQKGSREKRGWDILKGDLDNPCSGEEQRFSNPGMKYLCTVLGDISTRLPKLIKKTLIPQLYR